MMRVFIHIGTHKTGTTAIQTFASDNADWLRKNGVLYPSFDLIGGQRGRSHLKMIKNISWDAKVSATEDPAALLAKAYEVATADGLDILLSAESLCRLNDANARKVTDMLRTTLAGAEFVVLCGLRPRAEFAESLYHNKYRVYKKEPEDFQDWLKSDQANSSYEAILQRYADLLGAQTRPIPYSKSTRVDFVATFFKTVGVNITESLLSARMRNPSLDTVDCLAKKIVMQGSCDAKLSEVFNRFAFHNPLSSGYGFLDRDQEAAFDAAFAEEDQRMLALYPELESVLGAAVEPSALTPIDAVCQGMAHARAEAFFASRQNKAPKP